MEEGAEAPSRQHGHAIHEIYIRTLLLESHGLPCWNPAPAGNTSAVVPGDVGIYTPEGGFRTIFNLFDDVHLINEIPQTHSARPHTRGSHQELKRAVTIQRDILMKEETLGSGVSTEKLHSP